MLKEKNLKWAFLAFIAISVYTVIFLIKGWKHFEFDFKINFIEILTICVDIFLVYYISYVLLKKDSLHKSEKDLLIKYVEEFQNNKNFIVKSVNTYFDYNDVSKVQILKSDLKNLRNELSTKLDLLIDNNYIAKDSDTDLNLRKLTKNIWQDLTFEPERGTINFNRELYLNRVKTNSTLLDKKIFNLIKSINSK